MPVAVGYRVRLKRPSVTVVTEVVKAEPPLLDRAEVKALAKLVMVVAEGTPLVVNADAGSPWKPRVTETVGIGEGATEGA